VQINPAQGAAHNVVCKRKEHSTKMKHLELDIVKIAQLGVQNEEENFDFRAYLKGQDFKKVDKMFTD